jgi:hypothetical protein
MGVSVMVAVASGNAFQRAVLAPAELRQEVAARGVDQQLVARRF